MDAAAPGRSAREPGSASLDDVIEKIGIGYYHWRLLLVCGLGFAAAAMESALVGFLLAEVRTHWSLNEHQVSIVPLVSSFGSITGAAFWGVIADRYGRRPAFIFTAVIVSTFGALSAFSGGVVMLALCRFIVGFGLGGNIAIDFAVFGEMLPVEGRGKMLFCMAFFWPLGQLSVCALAWLIIPSLGWRWYLILLALPAALAALLRPLINETPRWLLLHGREEDAIEALTYMAQLNGKSRQQVGLIYGVSVRLEGETSALNPPTDDAWSNSFITTPMRLLAPKLWRITLAMCAFVVGLEIAGYGTLRFMPSFLQMRGFSSSGMYRSMLMSSGSEVPGILLAGVIANAFGRRRPLQLSLIMIAACLTGFANVKTNWWLTVFSCLASAAVEFGWALLHVFQVEAFSTDVRATGCGFTTMVGGIVTLASPVVTGVLLEGGHVWRPVIFFASVCLACSMTTFALLDADTETLNRSLADRAEGALKKKLDA